MNERIEKLLTIDSASLFFSWIAKMEIRKRAATRKFFCSSIRVAEKLKIKFYVSDEA